MLHYAIGITSFACQGKLHKEAREIPNDLIRHYDLLIDENNDPVHDPEPLHQYMDQWDGPTFLDLLDLTKEKNVLEIGVGTGRLAVRTALLCGAFCGIDISPKTIQRASPSRF